MQQPASMILRSIRWRKALQDATVTPNMSDQRTHLFGNPERAVSDIWIQTPAH